jgi:hypothetical protein
MAETTANIKRLDTKLQTTTTKPDDLYEILNL